MRRTDYIRDDEFLISTKNEPSIYSRYPDMYVAYENFSKFFNVAQENFILTNGCENALRIALIMTCPERIYIEYPTWGLVAVICEAFHIPYKYMDFHYDNSEFVLDATNTDGAIYTTDEYSNVIKHKNVNGYNDTTMLIVDETYTNRVLSSKNKIFEKNKIIIGSFSKCADPAIRLGYVLFDDEYNDRFQMLREQYIGGEAIKYLRNPSMHYNPIWKWDIPYEIVTQHSVYTTVKAKTLPIPHKHFLIDGIDLCRFGNVGDAWKKEYIEWKLNTSHA